MMGTNLSIKTEPNGSVRIETKDASITIDSLGNIHISSEGPVELTGACQAKLDQGNLDANKVNEALGRRLTKKR